MRVPPISYGIPQLGRNVRKSSARLQVMPALMMTKRSKNHEHEEEQRRDAE